MRIKVARFDDNNAADLIVDELLSTELAMRERGRNELDEQQFSRSIYSISLPLNHDMRPGQIIEVNELESGEVWRGKVQSVSLSVNSPRITQTIKVDRALV